LLQAYFFSSFFASAGAAGVAGADDPAGAEDDGAEDDGALELGAFFDDDCSPHAARVNAAAAAISRVLVIRVP
jgi:hypothetical protein